MNLKPVLNLAKLGAAGGVIFGIAFAFVAQDPDASTVGPAPAQADVADFTGIVIPAENEFAGAVVSMGMQPRAFDYNGNTMYFASGTFKMKPVEFLRASQEHLVQTGVNEANHADLVPVRHQAKKIDWLAAGDNHKAQKSNISKLVPAAKSMMAGDVVPTEVSSDYVEMVGFDLNRDANDVENLVDPQDRSGKTVRNLMGGYRYLDARWEPASRTSSVTAVWTGKGFTGERMEGEGDQSPPDPNVPACMGCEREHRVQSLDNGEWFQSNMYTTNVGIGPTYEYYKSAMLQRGWTESGVQPMMDRMGELMADVDAVNQQGRLLSLQKGDQALQLAIMPGAKRTKVMTLHETAGAQNELPEQP